jgi:hypothetical protein
MVKPRLAMFPLLAFAFALGACTASRNAPLPYMLQPGYKTTYYDRNGDGIVDFEFHELPDSDHYDWALTDRDFDGRYDLRLRYGMTVGYDRVDISVPHGVHIRHGRLPVVIIDEPPTI